MTTTQTWLHKADSTYSRARPKNWFEWQSHNQNRQIAQKSLFNSVSEASDSKRGRHGLDPHLGQNNCEQCWAEPLLFCFLVFVLLLQGVTYGVTLWCLIVCLSVWSVYPTLPPPPNMISGSLCNFELFCVGETIFFSFFKIFHSKKFFFFFFLPFLDVSFHFEYFSDSGQYFVFTPPKKKKNCRLYTSCGWSKAQHNTTKHFSLHKTEGFFCFAVLYQMSWYFFFWGGDLLGFLFLKVFCHFHHSKFRSDQRNTCCWDSFTLSLPFLTRTHCIK